MPERNAQLWNQEAEPFKKKKKPGDIHPASDAICKMLLHHQCQFFQLSL